MSNIRRHTIAGKEATAREAAALEILGAIAQGMDVETYEAPAHPSASYNKDEAARIWRESWGVRNQHFPWSAADIAKVLAEAQQLRAMGDEANAKDLENWTRDPQTTTIHNVVTNETTVKVTDRTGKLDVAASAARTKDANTSAGRADYAKRGAVAATAAGAHCGALAASWQSAVAMMVMLFVLATLIHFLIRAVIRRGPKPVRISGVVSDVSESEGGLSHA